MTGNGRVELLNVLKKELEFLEGGGYRQPRQNPWKANSIFLDSPTCINRNDPRRARPCANCPLMQFVPPEGRKAAFPCHHIPLSEAGDTVNSVERWGDQSELEEIVGGWLRVKIRDIQLQMLGRGRAPSGQGGRDHR